MRRKARMCTREVMGRYWNDPSPFASDLVSRCGEPAGSICRENVQGERFYFLCMKQCAPSPKQRERDLIVLFILKID